MILKRSYKRNKFIAAELRREVRGKSENGQQPVLELQLVSVSFHGMNARVSDVLGTTRRRRRPASHKYEIRVFGALSIKRNPDSCCCFYDSYCIHRFWLLPQRRVIGNTFATKTSFDSRIKARATRFLRRKIQQDICDIDFFRIFDY